MEGIQATDCKVIAHPISSSEAFKRLEYGMELVTLAFFAISHVRGG